MFDPSEMDLDLDNLDKNKWEENKNNNKKEEISKEKTDILNDIIENTETDTKSETLDNIIENNTNEAKDDVLESILEEDKVNDNEKNTVNNNEVQHEEKIIFDINIDSLEYLIKYLISKEYDFFTLEPEENKVKVTFRKDNEEIEVKYIKFPIYTNILLRAKAITKLKIEDTKNSQEWKTEINLNKNIYKVISKTVPSPSGERLFFKVTKTEKKASPKKKEKMSIWKMIWIFAWLLFTTLVIWGVFMAIILFNSNSVSDLQFFNTLWINTNVIKDFAAHLVNWIFGFIVLIEIIFLFVFSYKALLTKKDFKQKKIHRIIISIFFLILATTTLLTWMFLAKKIDSLKWLNYWKIEYYDNSKFISEIFWKEWSKIDINENIIGPITIRFNISEFIQKLKDDWFNPNKINWTAWKIEWEIWIDDKYFIHTFNKIGITSINLIIKWKNIKWEEDIKENEIAKVNINNIIEIEKNKLDNWWIKFIFDANNLKHLWKIKWYYIPSLKWKTDDEANKIITKALSKEVLTWYKFHKNIFEGEEYYWIKIITADEEKEELDKIFIVSVEWKTEISWKIEITQDIDNENKYNFIFKNPKTNLWEAPIKKYIWKIQDFDKSWKEKIINIEREANLTNLENTSKASYIFDKTWKHIIKLEIIDSEWKTHNMPKETIDISKTTKLLTKLNFSSNNKQLDYKKDVIYESNNNTYYIDDLLAPSKLEIDATKIRSLNQKYGLLEVSWDLNNDWNFEKIWKKTTYNINTEWISSFKVKYKFVNKNLETDVINIIETIHTTSIDKEYMLDLKIIKPNSYVPVIVEFDASSSIVTGKNIDKFIFDYWDGTAPEERDWKNTWHKYVEAWDYNIKLTVITSDWKKYSTNKKLILKNKPQTAKITTSLKQAPVYQTIDFSAEDSIWEVATYLWDFWDWKTSTEISPSHFYKKEWVYKVKLTLEYTNRNQLEDEIEIKIYKD